MTSPRPPDGVTTLGVTGVGVTGVGGVTAAMTQAPLLSIATSIFVPFELIAEPDVAVPPSVLSTTAAVPEATSCPLLLVIVNLLSVSTLQVKSALDSHVLTESGPVPETVQLSSALADGLLPPRTKVTNARPSKSFFMMNLLLISTE
jgi:hypothetical protein